MRITVAIRTGHGARYLDDELSRLLQLRLPQDAESEVLLASNNCSDETDSVIARHEGACQSLFEPRQIGPGATRPDLAASLLTASRVLRALLLLPLVWCVVGGATLWAMPIAALIVLALAIWRMLSRRRQASLERFAR